MLKTVGYIMSAMSVLLLGIVAWKTAAQDPLILDCLIAGMLASVVGLVLRWLAYRSEQQAKRRRPATILHLVERRGVGRS